MKKIVSLILALSILSSTVLATSESALKNNLSNTNQEISETKKELTNVQNDKKLTLKDIDNLDKQIETKESEIAYLESDIATLEKNIVVAEENIQYSVEQYEKKDLLRQERLVAYYKCGDLSFWDTLLASESITDFFYRYRLLNTIIDYDNHIHSTSDNVAKNTWEKIKLEELNHVGELLGLLDFLDNKQTKYVQDGINEFHQILNDKKNI